MKLLKLYVVLQLLSIYSFGQETKKIIEKYPDTKQVAKEYYVLKKNKNIKHGLYVAYKKLNKEEYETLQRKEIKIEDYILEKGSYTHGLKDGNWVEKSSTFKGAYSNNVRVGVWDTYKNGEKILSYNYDTNKKVGREKMYKEGGRVIQWFNHDVDTIDKVAFRVYPEYPMEAVEQEIEGTVIIEYDVHENCSVDNFRVVQSVSKECDEAALKAMQEFAELFKKYATHCKEESQSLPVNFILFR